MDGVPFEAERYSFKDELRRYKTMSIMEIKGVRYSYDNKRNVLKGVSAELDAGKMYAILGPSGCGKTTLLSMLGGLDSPLEGQILFDGQDIEITGLAAHRKNNVAFIFQC